MENADKIYLELETDFKDDIDDSSDGTAIFTKYNHEESPLGIYTSDLYDSEVRITKEQVEQLKQFLNKHF